MYAYFILFIVIVLYCGYSFVTSDFIGRINIKLSRKINQHLESLSKIVLFLCAALSAAITLAIVASIFIETVKFFSIIPIHKFLFGTNWNPQLNYGPQDNQFGFLPTLVGTLLITFIAILIAVPIGLHSAIYISEYMPKKRRNIIKSVIEMLAGVPTVVYGYFAAIIIGPFIKKTGDSLGLDISLESALSAGIVMGIMITPYVMSLSYDALNAIPHTLKEGGMSLGLTKSETIVGILLPAAIPSIIGAVLLAISRAIGETMIVTMAAGLSSNLTINPLESVTTITAQIVSLLSGDQAFDNVKTLSAFALASTLFFLTLILNISAITIIRKHRKQYG